MDTRPKHGQVTERKSVVFAAKEDRGDTACPRQRFFVEARKRDDGDRSPGVGGPQGPPLELSSRSGDDAFGEHS